MSYSMQDIQIKSHTYCSTTFTDSLPITGSVLSPTGPQLSVLALRNPLILSCPYRQQILQGRMQPIYGNYPTCQIQDIGS